MVRHVTEVAGSIHRLTNGHGVGPRARRGDARTGKVGPRDGKQSAYLLRGAFGRTVFVLGMRGGTKIIPVREVSGFGDGEVLDVPGSPRVVHAPGHTGGSAAILLEDRGHPVHR